MKILLVRGAFLNKYEGQNYNKMAKRHDLLAISSFFPIQDKFSYPVKKFFSPFDIGVLLGRVHPLLAKIVNYANNRIFGDGQFLYMFENFVRQTGPYDVVIGAETYFGYDTQIATLKKEGYIKKFVSVCWEIIPHNNESVLKKKKIKNVVVQEIDLFICPTHLAKKALMSEGIGENKIKVIRVGVDQTKFMPFNIKKNDKLTILFVGRLVEEKGVRELPTIFRQIDKKYLGNRTLLFRVVGTGPLRKWLEAELVGLDATIETIEYEKMPSEYQSADVLVMPSKTTNTWAEQYGMVIAEAQSCGLPVVAYNSGAIKEVVGEGGVVVREGDVEAMSEKVIEILENSDLNKHLSNKAIAYAKAIFDSAKSAKLLETLLLDS